MTDKFVMSARQAAELDFALARAGWKAKDVKKLCAGGLLNSLLDVLSGEAVIQKAAPLIDLGAKPFVPKGFTLERHTGMGTVSWEKQNFCIKTFAEQRWSEGVRGKEMLRLLQNEKVANANVLDFLLARPYLIPDYFKGKRICFWGTTFRNNRSQCHYIRCLSWTGSSWIDADMCINVYFWKENDFALFLFPNMR